MTDYKTLHKKAEEKIKKLNYKKYWWIETKDNNTIIRRPGQLPIDLDC